ncbi:nuclear transport factor 2 family protein [Aliiglaciecola lipolytica]|uniref:SnoaL-like domain-containing protein n=1 Tax=Aliiglaciecola lipolytica E3 TaxID=1127673 RepID=K6WZZ0_9ALTE|nr:nuclear transport factor 2 family protein [Aliiglaciecola lipolytica]GAC13989.1 hypothetical protein GLIP_1348 [Aliiglaciecola lipolytica E3]
MIDSAATVTALEQRLLKAEDELALRNLMVRYGLAVDCADIAAALACHTNDAVYIVSSPKLGRDDCDSNDLKMEGHQAIADMLNSEMHQSLVPNCAHTVGPYTIEINGDTARATGYSRLYHRETDDFKLMRVSINEWQFVRHEKSWLISCRESRVVGESEAQTLLLNAAFSH